METTKCQYCESKENLLEDSNGDPICEDCNAECEAKLRATYE